MCSTKCTLIIFLVQTAYVKIWNAFEGVREQLVLVVNVLDLGEKRAERVSH